MLSYMMVSLPKHCQGEECPEHTPKDIGGDQYKNDRLEPTSMDAFMHCTITHQRRWEHSIFSYIIHDLLYESPSIIATCPRSMQIRVCLLLQQLDRRSKNNNLATQIMDCLILPSTQKWTPGPHKHVYS